MFKAWEDLFQEGIDVGEKKGREKGREEGREEGEKAGREKGREEGREEGEKKGREEGEKKGREECIRGYVTASREENISESSIQGQLVKFFKLSPEDARTYLL